MGILARFKNIMSANINALLDKAEDPEKMVDQILRDLQEELGEVKAETAGIMADEARAKRELDEAKSEVSKLQSYAEKAIVAGNDDDARLFLQKKQAKEEEVAQMQQAYQLAADNAAKMQQMYQRLTQQIDEMEAKRSSIKAKMAVAKTQQKINEMGASVKNAAGSLSEFERMEQKADQMLDRVNAMASLNAQDQDASLEALMSQYDSPQTEVEDELAALKKKLGK